MNLADPNQWREWLRRRQASAENRARKAGMAFTLRPGFALTLYDQQGGRCAVSGIEFNLQRFPDALVKHPFAPSIDRKLSSGGYTEDNVRLVCVAVNFGMGQWGEEVYMMLARAAVARETKQRTYPDPADDSDWYARQRERIAAVEALRKRLGQPEREKLRRHIASLKRALTMGPERLRAAAEKAKKSKRKHSKAKPTGVRETVCRDLDTPRFGQPHPVLISKSSWNFSRFTDKLEIQKDHPIYILHEELPDMAATPSENYSTLDVPEVLTRLFHPRPEVTAFGPPTSAEEVLIPVASGVVIGARFYAAGPAKPTLLFFHGNGEIVADYEELGPLYTQRGLNFLPADYRGYGRSTGNPTVTAMMSDCHVILAFIHEWLHKRTFSGPLVVMGRSLGSASALELAAFHQDLLDGLIIESGFAYAGPLLELLGVDLQDLGFNEEVGFRNVDKIRHWTKPLLVIHAEYDQIIPYFEGLELYHACPSKEKTLLKVAGAGHNDILSVGFKAYMEAVSSLGILLSRR